MAIGGWNILGTRLKTQFSNNIRNNFGFLNRAAPEGIGARDKLFVQEGRKVYREVVPMVSEMILGACARPRHRSARLKRLWLHQANINMNEAIGRKVSGREPAAGRERHHSRHVRQHQLCRLDHRLPHRQRRLRGRRNRASSAALAQAIRPAPCSWKSADGGALKPRTDRPEANGVLRPMSAFTPGLPRD